MSDDNRGRDGGAATCVCGCPKVGDGCDCRFCDQPYPTPAPHDGPASTRRNHAAIDVVATALPELPLAEAERIALAVLAAALPLHETSHANSLRLACEERTHFELETFKLREQLAAANARADTAERKLAELGTPEIEWAVRWYSEGEAVYHHKDSEAAAWHFLRLWRERGVPGYVSRLAVVRAVVGEWREVPPVACRSCGTTERVLGDPPLCSNCAAYAPPPRGPLGVAADAAADGHSATETGAQ